MRKTIILFFLSAVIACGSGGGDSPPPPQARIEVVSATQMTTSYNKPSLLVIVKNTGNATGYNVGCDAQAVNTSGVIIDTAHAFPANLGNILSGQSAQDEAVFFNLVSHNDYKGYTINCTWLTR